MLTRWRDLIRTELSPLAALAAAALGLLSFLKVAEETGEGETHGVDSAILLALRTPGDPGTPIGPLWLQHALADITALGGYAVLTLLVTGVAIYLVAIGRTRNALLVTGAAVSGAALSQTLKFGFARPRPDLVAHLVEAGGGSFPSGHAMLSAVIYLTLGALIAQAQQTLRVKILVLGFAVALTLLVGASRVYLGVHWPSDVLAGWAMGAAWAGVWRLIATRAARRS